MIFKSSFASVLVLTIVVVLSVLLLNRIQHKRSMPVGNSVPALASAVVPNPAADKVLHHRKRARHVASPSLGYSCATIRWAVATFPRAWLEAEGRKRGITAAQRRQAAHCLRGG